MERMELTHDTPTEYRAIARIERNTAGDYQRVDFDVYGGPGRGQRNDIRGNCHVSIEQREGGKQRGKSASAELNLSEMMELYAMLGEAIERAQRATHGAK